MAFITSKPYKTAIDSETSPCLELDIQVMGAKLTEGFHKSELYALKSQLTSAIADIDYLLNDEEPDLTKPPCRECWATSRDEAAVKCIYSGGKDNCHGHRLWPDNFAD